MRHPSESDPGSGANVARDLCREFTQENALTMGYRQRPRYQRRRRCCSTCAIQ
ncbi:unnamed protein product, partial [Effrenium voratum]